MSFSWSPTASLECCLYRSLMVMYAGDHIGRPAFSARMELRKSEARLFGNTTAMRDRS